LARESIERPDRIAKGLPIEWHTERQIKPVLSVPARAAFRVHDPISLAACLGLGAIDLDKLGLELGKEHRVSRFAHQGGGLIVDLELVTIVSRGQLGILKTLYLSMPD